MPDERERRELTEHNTGFGTALYYPYIVPDVNWLKHALLYWDRVRRIVPHFVFRPADDCQLFMDAGLLINTEAEPYREAASELFIDELLPVFEDSALCETHLSQARHLFQKDCVTVYPGKVTGELQQRLEEMELSRQVGDLLQMEADVAGFYMTTLASVMSQAIRAPLVTNATAFAIAGEYLAFGTCPSHVPDSDPATHLLAQLEVPFPSPRNLEDVSIRQVIQFSQCRGDERRRFRQAVETIAEGLTCLDDPNAVTDFLAQKRDEVQEAIDDHTQVMEELAVGGVTSFLKISCPAWIMLAAGAVASWNANVSAALGVAGLAVGVVDWWAQHRRGQRDAARSCPWHYLLSVNELGTAP